jgi:hypothetical protein
VEDAPHKPDYLEGFLPEARAGRARRAGRRHL